MKKVALYLALGTLALCAVPSANAADQTRTPVAADRDATVQATDMSSHRRHWRRHRVVRAYPRYYRSYGYYPRPYYYRPAPVVTFGFGFGPRFHRHHWHRW
jgi:hypothetical protein